MRLIRTLECIPHEPQSVSTGEIVAAITQMGFRASARTVQRDLLFLERCPLNVECVDDRKPFRWSKVHR